VIAGILTLPVKRHDASTKATALPTYVPPIQSMTLTELDYTREFRFCAPLVVVFIAVVVVYLFIVWRPVTSATTTTKVQNAGFRWRATARSSNDAVAVRPYSVMLLLAG